MSKQGSQPAGSNALKTKDPASKIEVTPADVKKKGLELKSLEVLKWASTFTRSLLDPTRFKEDTNNPVSQLLYAIWPFGSEAAKSRAGRSQVIAMFILGLFRTILMDRSTDMARSLVRVIFKRDTVSFYRMVRSCVLISAIASLCNAWYKYAEETLAVEWRGTLTKLVHKHYFAQSNYYHVSNLLKPDGQPVVRDPDSQIVGETLSISRRLVTLVSSIASALPPLAWFTFKLARSHGLVFAFLPHLYLMAAYEVAQRIFPKDLGIKYKLQAGAVSRYAMAAGHMQSHSESIAALKGAPREEAILDSAFKATLKVSEDLHWTQAQFKFIFRIAYVSGSGLLRSDDASGASGFMASTRYALGVMLEMLIANGKLLDAHAQSEHMKGLCARLGTLVVTLQKLEASHKKSKADSIMPGESIRFDNVEISTPTGHTLVKDLSWELKHGGSLLLTGHNGAGKSSIFRCLGGLWPIKQGKVLKPGAGTPAFENLKNIFYVPQKPYLTLGTLKEQVTYPLCESAISDEALDTLLDLVQLSHLKGTQATTTAGDLPQWEGTLSRGEQQCLAIARLLFHEPKFAILDECTSAVSREMERLLYHECTRRNISYITICHRPALRAFHDKNLNLTGKDHAWEEIFIQEPDIRRQQALAIEASESHPVVAVSRATNSEAVSEERLALVQKTIPTASASTKRAIPHRSTISKLKLLLSLMIPGSLKQLAGLVSCIIMRTIFAEATSLTIGKLFTYMLRRDKGMFAAFAALNAALILMQGVADEATGYLQDKVSLSWCSQLSKQARARFFRDNNLYRLSQIDKRIEDADGRLTREIQELTTEFSEVWAKCITPLADVLWFTLRLQAVVGFTAMRPFFIYVLVTSLVIKRFLPDFDELNSREKKLEARFRFVHHRLAEHKEAVAFFGGDAMEESIAEREFDSLQTQMHNTRAKNGQYRFAAHALSKDYDAYSNVLSVGDLVSGFMQMNLTDTGNNLATQVEYVRGVADRTIGAYSKLFSLYETFSSLMGSATRVTELLDVLDDLSQEVKQAAANGARAVGNKVMMDQVTIVTPGEAACLAHNLSLEVVRGQSLMVTGRTASGKSSLFRVLAGLWPLDEGRGHVVCPSSICLVPQRPYFVIGSLADQVTYPESVKPQQRSAELEDRLLKALDSAGIAYLVDRHGWDKLKPWQDILSGGEQQRAALARVFYHHPDFAVLDECTDAVNVQDENVLYERLHSAGVTCITISKRLALQDFHPHELRLGAPTMQGWELTEVNASSATSS